uniref:Uncharacterized protein n=1 Tax=Panagrolaimus superbus TaxID=310955 RepID=A0A914Z7B1_9BILA
MPPTQQINTKVTTPSNSGTTSISINELEYLSKAYKLNSNQSTITIETNAQQSLITIAASLSDAEKNALGYKIGDLIQTCIINGVPCNMERDFTQIYDVDYGFCYTFNYAALYNTTQMGSNHGLKMVVLSDINEYIATSSEQGIKVVVHYQEESPFPNVGGYRSATGKNIDLRVTYGLVSRLDAPYGTCNNLDKLKELNQPFYFNGTYTVEGCYRSCFQQKVSVACNCSDPRFPLPTDLSTSFCKISDIQKYNCYEKYIEENGDYYNVEDCSCAISCDDTTFNSAVYYSNWPYGTFFYQALCTNATFTNGTDCQKYYRENGVLVQVSYARLGYETIEEVPAFDLFNNLAGNTGLWIGFSAITAAEFILVFIQICLWICTPWELKEVPSCRQRNYPEPETDSENCTEETNSTAAIVGAGSAAGIGGAYSNLFNGNMNKSAHLIEPKSFPNEIRRRHHGLMVTDPSSIFESIKPVSHVDVYDSQLITPTPVQSIITEVVPEI